MVNNRSQSPGETQFKPAELRTKLLQAFTPHQPIYLPQFLAGRIGLIDGVTDAVNTEGQHIVLYGDRGIGKTSIARVVSFLVQEPKNPVGRRCALISCDANDTFTTIWKKVGQEILLTERQMGFRQEETFRIIGRLDLDQTVSSPNDARIFLESLQNPAVIVLDEFDRILDQQTRSLMADTIKLFSDYRVRSKLVIVGVGKSLSDLLHEHLSISRNLAQIPVEPMTMNELAQIIQNGCRLAGLTFTEGLDREIAKLSQGYPHYTHLLGLWMGRKAIDHQRLEINIDDLNQAIPDVLKNAQAGLQEQYEQATSTEKTKAQFKRMLLACALTNKDSLGRFPLGALQAPLKLITGRDYTTGAYQGYLARFCDPKRGSVLERSGLPKSYRWRFLNPPLIPFIVLQGIREGLIQTSQVVPRQRA